MLKYERILKLIQIMNMFTDLAWSREFLFFSPCTALLHQESENVSQLCLTLCNPIHGLQLARILCPWNSPGENTAVGCRSLLQGTFLTQGWNPCLPHGRQILYHLSHQGSPFQEVLPHEIKTFLDKDQSLSLRYPSLYHQLLPTHPTSPLPVLHPRQTHQPLLSLKLPTQLPVSVSLLFPLPGMLEPPSEAQQTSLYTK